MRAYSPLPLLLCAVAGDLFAEEGVPAALAKTTIEPGATDQLLKVTLGLGVIVGLIFLIAWVVKRMGYMQFGGHDEFRVVSSLAVGQRERLIVVEVGGEQILVGVAPGRINKVHTLSTPIETAGKGPQPPAAQFAGKLRQALNRRASS